MKPYCVTVVLPGGIYIKTAEQLIHKAAQPADVVCPLVLSISMATACLSQTADRQIGIFGTQSGKCCSAFNVLLIVYTYSVEPIQHGRRKKNRLFLSKSGLINGSNLFHSMTNDEAKDML